MGAVALRKVPIPPASPAHPAARREIPVHVVVRKPAPEWLVTAIAWAAGIALFTVAWALVAKLGGRIPDPVTVAKAAAKIFSDPFYVKGPNDQGIGWNVLSSLKRVGIGFGLAALVGIPLGFMIGRWRFLSAMVDPIIALLKPVSPLAWLPIGLLVFKAANPAAIYVIFVCSLWPMIVNTSVGVAWLVIVAAELLTGGVGIGFWVWDEWNNLKVEHIMIAIFTIGIVGLLLEQALVLLTKKFAYDA